MNKDFAPHAEALELKALEFDEPCFAYYDEDIYLFTVREQDDVHDYWTPAPTYSQAFRWFREKHNLHSHISLGISDEQDRSEFEYDEYTFVIEGVKELDFNNYGEESFYKTPEEAELECLKKLIEIVKSKQE